jgi:Ni,Fe-hydrogenase III small subunit
MVVAVAVGSGLMVMFGEEVGWTAWLRRVVMGRDGGLSCEDVRAQLRPRYGRERGGIREATEPREITDTLVIGPMQRSAEVKELAGFP